MCIRYHSMFAGIGLGNGGGGGGGRRGLSPLNILRGGGLEYP